MMSKSRSCMLLLLSVVAGFLQVSDAVIPVKYVCPGAYVEAFQNIEVNNCSAHVSLHISGNRHMQIAVWSIQNCIRNEIIQSQYHGRLIFHHNGTITITNFDFFDQAKYVVISKMYPLSKIYEVQLVLMVAPTKACKPMIEKLGNSLQASLKANDCGKPVAVPYCTDSDSVFNTNEPILKLIPGMEAKEYYACIKGVALSCVKNVTSHDYCTTFKTEGSPNPPDSSVKCNANAFMVGCIILGIVCVVTTFSLLVIFIRYRRRKNNLKLKYDTERPKSNIECDLKNDKEEENTEQQRCNDSDKLGELMKLRDRAFVKYVFTKK